MPARTSRPCGSSTWRAADEPADIPMGMMVPGIPGTLNLRHPVACQALLDAAAGAGATVVRGVRGVTVAGGSAPSLSFATNGTAARSPRRARRRCGRPGVGGAQGRGHHARATSTDQLHRRAPRRRSRRRARRPRRHGGRRRSLLRHVPPGRWPGARLSVSGGVRAAPLLGSRRRGALPRGVRARSLSRGASRSWRRPRPARARPIRATTRGPIRRSPKVWCSIGDAAGHNDPIIGQGLSIALRDARIVRDLVLDGARDPAAFRPYGEERAARMERLRLIADMVAVSQVRGRRQPRRPGGHSSARRLAAMDPEYFTLLAGAFVGPEQVPDELVDVRAAGPHPRRLTRAREVSPRRCRARRSRRLGTARCGPRSRRPNRATPA